MVINLFNIYINAVHIFLIAFGVVLGSSIFNGLGAIITGSPPLKAMLDLAKSTKIWAVAVALGGTLSSLNVIDKGLFYGEVKALIKQAIYILVALMGANTGYLFIRLIQRWGEIWGR